MSLVKDDNRQTVIGGVSTVDGSVIPICVNPSNGAVCIETISSHSSVSVGDRASRDENSVPTMLGVDSSDDTKTCPPAINSDTNRIFLQVT